MVHSAKWTLLVLLAACLFLFSETASASASAAPRKKTRGALPTAPSGPSGQPAPQDAPKGVGPLLDLTTVWVPRPITVPIKTVIYRSCSAAILFISASMLTLSIVLMAPAGMTLGDAGRVGVWLLVLCGLAQVVFSLAVPASQYSRGLFCILPLMAQMAAFVALLMPRMPASTSSVNPMNYLAALMQCVMVVPFAASADTTSAPFFAETASSPQTPLIWNPIGALFHLAIIVGCVIHGVLQCAAVSLVWSDPEFLNESNFAYFGVLASSSFILVGLCLVESVRILAAPRTVRDHLPLGFPVGLALTLARMVVLPFLSASGGTIYSSLLPMLLILVVQVPVYASAVAYGRTGDGWLMPWVTKRPSRPRTMASFFRTLAWSTEKLLLLIGVVLMCTHVYYSYVTFSATGRGSSLIEMLLFSTGALDNALRCFNPNSTPSFHGVLIAIFMFFLASQMTLSKLPELGSEPLTIGLLTGPKAVSVGIVLFSFLTALPWTGVFQHAMHKPGAAPTSPNRAHARSPSGTWLHVAATFMSLMSLARPHVFEFRLTMATFGSLFVILSVLVSAASSLLVLRGHYSYFEADGSAPYWPFWVVLLTFQILMGQCVGFIVLSNQVAHHNAQFLFNQMSLLVIPLVVQGVTALALARDIRSDGLFPWRIGTRSTTQR